MNKIIYSGLVIGAMLSLVGCGGGSSTDTPTVTGQFVDTYVSGLNYECSSGMAGITNDMGEYTCNVGDTVEFSLGGYVLGSATASEGIVTPETLYPDNPEAALNVAQVIQSLDTDPTDDIITIPENFTDLDDVTVTPEDANFDALIEDELSVPLVSEEEAQAHLDETKLMLLLAGKTLYLAEYDVVDKFVFNADLSSITWTELLPEANSEGGVWDVTIDGAEMTVNTEEGPIVLTLANQTDTYLEFNVNDDAEPARLYYNQEDAVAYYDSLQPDLESLIVGTTKYFVTSLGVTGSRSFATDGTYTANITTANGTVLDTSGTYTIVNNVIIINRTSPNTLELVLTYIGEEAGGLGFTGSINGGEPFQTVSFSTEAERDAYVALLQAELEASIVGQTKYFVNTQGITGYRSYATDGSYTGELTLADGTVLTVSGTYEIAGYVLTLNRTSPNNMTLIITYTGEEVAGGVVVLVSVNGGEPTESVSFSTEAERDDYLTSYLEGLIVGKTKYFATSLGVTGSRSYAADGTYTANITTANGTVLDTSGTYTIVNNVITINRTSPNTLELVLTYAGEEAEGSAFIGSIDGGEPFETVSFDTAAERDAYLTSNLESFFVGKTKYFANSQGDIGHRTYAVDGTYTGEVTLANSTVLNVSGTYDIEGNVLTINRTAPSSVLLVLTYIGTIDGIVTMSITVNSGTPFETREFDTEAERDDYVASLVP